MVRYLNLYEDGQVGRSWPSRKLAEISRSRLVKCVALLVVRDNNDQFIVKRDRIAELLREPRTKMSPEEIEAQRQSWVRGEMALGL